jgi:hypothetical protein
MEQDTNSPAFPFFSDSGRNNAATPDDTSRQ